MQKIISGTILLFMMGVPASAAGGVWCDADDRHAAITVHAPMARSGGVYALEGTLQFKQPSVPAEMRRMDLGLDDLNRFAISGRKVSLTLRRDHAVRPPQFVELEIDATGADGEYEGRYVAVVHNGQQPKLKLTGAIACGAD